MFEILIAQAFGPAPANVRVHGAFGLDGHGQGGTLVPFSYYFAQREAVESVIWLYDVKGARDKFDLIRFDSSGAVSAGMFPEDWSRYVCKMATGAGKTKVMSLLIACAPILTVCAFSSTIRCCRPTAMPGGTGAMISRSRCISRIDKDPDTLDIKIPKLSRRYDREFQDLSLLDPAAFYNPKLPVKPFTPEETREIVFKRILDGEAVGGGFELFCLCGSAQLRAQSAR